MDGGLVYRLIITRVSVFVKKITFYKPCVLMQRSKVISRWLYQLYVIILS
jgi:hypothetical protein